MVRLRKHLQQGIFETEVYCDLFYKIRKINGISNFATISQHYYQYIRCNPYIMRQTACFVMSPSMVDDYAAFLNYAMAVKDFDTTMASS